MFQWFKQHHQSLRIGLSLSPDKLTLLVLEEARAASSATVKEIVYFPYIGDHAFVELRQQVLSFLKERHLTGLPCYYVLHDQDYQLLSVEPPPVPEEELVDALRWKVKDLIQADIDNVAIDIFEQPEKKSVFTVVVEKHTIRQIVEFVRQVNLIPQTIDIPELAYRNLLDYFPDNSRGIALVVLRRQEGKIMIIKQSRLYFSRRFALNHNSDDINTLSEEQLILEIQRSLDYYERQLSQVTPSELLISGVDINQLLMADIQQHFPQSQLMTHLGALLYPKDETVTHEMLVVSGAALRQKVAA